jgi:hypothetical protein
VPTLKVVGGTASTVSDSEGKFSLNLQAKLYVIEISSMVYFKTSKTTNNQR